MKYKIRYTIIALLLTGVLGYAMNYEYAADQAALTKNIALPSAVDTAYAASPQPVYTITQLIAPASVSQPAQPPAAPKPKPSTPAPASSTPAKPKPSNPKPAPVPAKNSGSEASTTEATTSKDRPSRISAHGISF